jgi:hypothetical protein
VGGRWHDLANFSALDCSESTVYVRFVVDEIDADSGVALGIFQAMFRLWRAGMLAPHEEAWWSDVRAWFNRKLEEPDRFSRSRRPGARKAAVSWFKAGAKNHIRRAREMTVLLAEHEIQSRMLWTRRAGYVVYEDAFQVHAEPFRPEHR